MCCCCSRCQRGLDEVGRTLKNSLPKWVTSRTVRGFNLAEISVGLLNATFILFHRPVAKLAVGYPNWRVVVLLVCLQIGHGCVGLYAALRRRVRTTKYYLWSLPVCTLVCLLTLNAFLRTRCDCSNYRQCEVVVSFSQGQLVNYHFSSEGRARLLKPAPEEPLRRLSHAHNVANSTQPESWLHLLPLGASGVEALDQQGELGDEALGVQLEKAGSSESDGTQDREQLLKELLRHWCSCEGSISKPGTARRTSCFVDPGPESDASCDQQYGRSWCWITEGNEETCEEAGFELYDAEKKAETTARSVKRKWSYEICEAPVSMDSLCGRPKCQCSRTAMKPDGPADLLEPGTQEYGLECKLWDKQDVREWCFVGFESACADKQAHFIEPTKDMRSPEEVFQYKSSLPCQENKIEDVEDFCAFVICLLCIPLVLLLLVQPPAIAVIYLFLQNHCGDCVREQEQFEVDVSSSSSDEFATGVSSLVGSALVLAPSRKSISGVELVQFGGSDFPAAQGAEEQSS